MLAVEGSPYIPLSLAVHGYDDGLGNRKAGGLQLGEPVGKPGMGPVHR
jgi:hypothetical protein